MKTYNEEVERNLRFLDMFFLIVFIILGITITIELILGFSVPVFKLLILVSLLTLFVLVIHFFTVLWSEKLRKRYKYPDYEEDCMCEYCIKQREAV